LKEGVAAACVWRARRRARLWLLQELQLQEVAAAEPQLQDTTAAAAAARLRRPRAVPARRPGRRPLKEGVAAACVRRARRRARLWLLQELQLQEVAAAAACVWRARRRARLWLLQELQLQEVAVAVAVAVVSTLAVFPAEGEPSAGTTPKVTRTLHAL